MNNKMACFLVFCVVSMGLIALLPTGTAQTYGGSVTTSDGSDPPNYKNYFYLGEYVYYYVHAYYTEDGTPLQYKYINITILSLEGVTVHIDTIETDQYGDAHGFWSGTGTPDQYTIYANYTGTNLATATFRVYDPIPDEAEVVTYVDNLRYNGGTPVYYFSPDDWVYFSIYIKDQYGNPYYEPRWLSPDDIQYWIYHNGDEVPVPPYTTQTGDEGYIDNDFRPSWYFINDEVYGLYQINATREYDGKHLGNITFEVVDVELEITPPKSKYAQGEEITISILTSIAGTIDVQILDPEGEALSNANWTDQELINGQWSRDYTLGTNLLDGDYKIQILKDGNIMESMGITVKKYALQIWTDAEAYLPGEEMTVFYTITHNMDGSGVTDATLEWIFEYFDEEDIESKRIKDSNPDPGSFGSFLVPIPLSASKSFNAELHVWANDTSDRSDYYHKSIDIGRISASIDIDDNKYLAGDFVVVIINAYIEFVYPLRDGDVHLNVSKEGIEITAYTTDNLKTDRQGTLTYILPLQTDAEIGLYTIAINVSKDGTNEWDTAQDTFEVVENREMTVELGFNRLQYYSGDSVTVTYTALRGDEIVENVNCEYSVFYKDNGDKYYITAGTSSDGEFTFNIPVDFEGSLTVELGITDSEGYKAFSSGNIVVARAGLLLKPDMNEYLPGDTVKVDYHVVGNEIPNANYYYEIKDTNGNIVKRESLTSSSGKFQFTVPDGNVPDSYTITGYITDGNGVEIAHSSVEITRRGGFMVSFTLDKNTYRPGETATLRYKISSVDGSEIPEKFTLLLGFGSSALLPFGGPSGPYRTVEVSDHEGSLTLKVPEDASDGTGYFYIFSDLPYGENGLASAQQEANVRANPNPFAENVFGDSSLLELILLVLLIIALFFGIAGWKKGNRALEEAKLPPWKKERPLPEPENFKGSDSEPEKSISPGPEETIGPEPITEPQTPPLEETTPPPLESPPEGY